MTIQDVSMTASSDMVCWPGTTVPGVEWEIQMSRGDIGDGSRWTIGAHNGTHLDAPSHFLPDAPGLDGVPLESHESLVGPAMVVELPDRVVSIRPEDIPWSEIASAERLLCKTSNSRQRLGGSVFDEDYVGIEHEAASTLVEAGVWPVGIAYLSFEPFGRDAFETHHVPLGARVAVVEGLDLCGIGPGSYRLTVLPLHLAGAEAGPADAILEEPEV